MAGESGQPEGEDRRPGESRLVVGLVRGVHGLRGSLRVEVLTDNRDRFAAGSVVYPEGAERGLTVTRSYPDGPGLLVNFAEVRDRNAADALRDTYLEARVDDQRPADEYYWHEVIGCMVTSSDGEELGRVTDVFRVGESEVFVVSGQRGEVLVPAVQSVVVEFAPGEGRMVVDGVALGLSGAEPDES